MFWLLGLAAAAIAIAAAVIAYKPKPEAPPAAPVIQYFTGDRDSISKEQPVLLQWSTTNAAKVNIEPGLGSLPPTGTREVTPHGSIEYILTAQGPGGPVTASFKVQVRVPEVPPSEKHEEAPDKPSAPQIGSFRAARSSLIRGETTELQFEVTGATDLSIEPDVGPVRAGLRSVKINPLKNTDYVLTARNDQGATKSLPVSVTVSMPRTPPPPPPPTVAPTVEFTGDLKQIEVGGSLKLYWKAAHATSVRIDPVPPSPRSQGFGNLDPDHGEVTVSPETTTEYRITAMGPGGRYTGSWPVRVVPKIVSFDAGRISIRGCDFAMLRWKVEGAAAISIDHDIGDVTAQPWIRVRPVQATEYTVTAVRPGGSATRTWTVPAFAPNRACP